MNQSAHHLDILPSRVNCLVLSLVDRKLLVPSTAVAEVLLSSELPRGGDNGLCYGWITWREQRIPLISLEVALGSRCPALAGTYRIAVFNAIGEASESGFFAARLDALPQSVQISAQTVLGVISPPKGGLLMEAVVGEDRVWVPDLADVESQVAAVVRADKSNKGRMFEKAPRAP